MFFLEISLGWNFNKYIAWSNISDTLHIYNMNHLIFDKSNLCLLVLKPLGMWQYVF